MLHQPAKTRFSPLVCSAGYPYRLGAATGAEPLRAISPWVWCALIVLCLVPRVAMAWKIDVICNDGVLYVRTATAIEQGDLAAAQEAMPLNVYPIILAVLHYAGLSWELAAKIWGVSMGTLAVLPLVGWIRRQFDERVAIAAGFLYATHPKLIQWSPEVMRDPTFWCLTAVSLYVAWRAATEARLRWYPLLGGVLTLAAYTRFEGWFLYLPAVGWAMLRGASDPPVRRKLAVGVLACLLIWPMVTLGTRALWLADAAKPLSVDFARLEYGVRWLRSWFDEQPALRAPPPQASATAPDPQAPAAAPLPKPNKQRWTVDPSSTTWLFVHTMERGLTPIFGVLMLAGLLKWRRLWLRPDNQACCAVALCTLAGMWVHLWIAGESSSRYALSIVLLASPFAALCMLGLIDGARRWTPGAAHYALLRTCVAAAIVLAVGAVGCGDALTSDDLGRHREARLGRWLHERYGDHGHILGFPFATLASYYSGWSVTPLSPESSLGKAYQAIDSSGASVIVMLRRRIQPTALDGLIAHAQQAGFVELSRSEMPDPLDEQQFVVLAHQRLLSTAAEAAASRR
ncbi:MAG TPA: glycosyltransferase family 39 protein [Pirellulales bacterium]|nr:glycosyltransferase family 39 protein [Pirellulales bacterium]